MPTSVILGAAMVASALPIAWWSVGRRTTTGVSAANLRRGFDTSADLRALTLEQPAGERVVAPLLGFLAGRARRLTPAGALDRLEHRIVAAGLQHQWSVERVLAGKALLTLIAALLTLTRLVATPSVLMLLVTAGAVALAWFLPDVLLDGRAKERRAKVQLELPDSIDQVTIAVEAGLGFEAALARVAANGEGILAVELARTLQDIQIGVPRADALDGLAYRTDLADLRHFVTAIRQAERYGLPVAHVLRVQSVELREKRRQRAEERAMKIPVKILLPLVFCILPTLFMVILGPAAVRIAGSGSWS